MACPGLLTGPEKDPLSGVGAETRLWWRSGARPKSPSPLLLYPSGRHPAPEWPRNPQLACRAAAPGRALLLLTGEAGVRDGTSSTPADSDVDGDTDADADADAATATADAAVGAATTLATSEGGFDPGATIGFHVLLANAELAGNDGDAAASVAEAEAEASGAWAAVGMLSGISGNVRTTDQVGLLPCAPHPRVRHHLERGHFDDEEAAHMHCMHALHRCAFAYRVCTARRTHCMWCTPDGEQEDAKTAGSVAGFKRRAGVGSATAPASPTAAVTTATGARGARSALTAPVPPRPMQQALRAPAAATVAVAGFESAVIAATQLQLSPAGKRVEAPPLAHAVRRQCTDGARTVHIQGAYPPVVPRACRGLPPKVKREDRAV